jgi:hypothetical protein
MSDFETGSFGDKKRCGSGVQTYFVDIFKTLLFPSLLAPTLQFRAAFDACGTFAARAWVT